MRLRCLGIAMVLLAGASCTADHRAGSAASAPTGQWYAYSIDGRPAIPADTARRPSIQFVADTSRVAGSTGCNRFTGSYTVTGSSLNFGALAVTRMACLDSAISNQESAFTAALGATTSFGITGDTLTLSAAGTPRLRFVR